MLVWEAVWGKYWPVNARQAFHHQATFLASSAVKWERKEQGEKNHSGQVSLGHSSLHKAKELKQLLHCYYIYLLSVSVCVKLAMVTYLQSQHSGGCKRASNSRSTWLPAFFFKAKQQHPSLQLWQYPYNGLVKLGHTIMQ